MTINKKTEYHLTEIYLGFYLVFFGITVLAVFFNFLRLPLQWPVTLSLLLLPFIFAVLHGLRSIGWQHIIFLLFLNIIASMVLECIGIMTGLIFGSYYYTSVLGPSFLGLVPYIIPIAWFAMIYPSYVIAELIIPLQWSKWKRILTVSALSATVAAGLDSILDPVMVATGCWVWKVEGMFFGIPVSNYLGWWLTTFIIVLLFLSFSHDGLSKSFKNAASFARLAIFSYAALGLCAAGIGWHIRLGGPVLIGLLVIGWWVEAGLWAANTNHVRINMRFLHNLRSNINNIHFRIFK